MTRSSALLALVAAGALGALTACDRPHTAVLCHNANCAEPTDPADDDTLPALRESLALELDGRPVIDGIELDLFWRAADGVCLFAHDLAGARTTLATEPAAEVAAYFARAGAITYGDGPFLVLLELKSHVAASTDVRHTPAQRDLHARCAWDVYAILADAAVAHRRDVRVIVQAFEPKLIAAMLATAPAALPVPVRYAAISGIPRPLDSETRNLGDYAGLPIDIVEVHPQWLLDGAYEGIASSDMELAFFMFAATAETFAAIEQYEPVYVNTSEARLVRRWLAR